MATFMWFSSEREIRSKKKRSDALGNELYITPSWDDNPLTTINGKARIVSLQSFNAQYPTGKVPRTSRDYGKIFVCRRGCNTRTATYTDEFVWEDIYHGADDILALTEFIQSRTKATRKRAGAVKADRQGRDDFVARDEEDEDGQPKTPRKRRKFDGASTPTSRYKDSPRKFTTPTHRRIITKKALEFTPLGTRVLSPTHTTSPFQL
ncbi:Origin recognition complex, subunit 1, partial [Cryomyces antarcticus]